MALWKTCGGMATVWIVMIHDVSNENRAPGCLGFVGDEILPSYVLLCCDYNKPLIIRIPIRWVFFMHPKH